MLFLNRPPLIATIFALVFLSLIITCQKNTHKEIRKDPNIDYRSYTAAGDELIIDRSRYPDKLHGFWLGQSIANWTGLVTEMDKIGNIGEIRTGDFYTRDDWGKADEPSIWGEGIPSSLSPTIDFVFEDSAGVWGADDDTDIEYMYQYLTYQNKTTVLTPEQIRDGWLKHIREEEENYLWVSNQRAFELMLEGILPPETSDPELNPHYAMIDAQLTTEIFGLYAPGRPDIALKLAELPIFTTARREAKQIAEFYVVMYSLAATVDPEHAVADQIMANAERASDVFPDSSYPKHMYDFVLSEYKEGTPWEKVRDELYQKYQVEQQAGYDITSQDLYCNGCFAAGINFASSLISLFYGEGDLKETIKIGALSGWDSDNPTATWGGMLGFIYGADRISEIFDREFSEIFFIHRTRKGFENGGFDTFSDMAEKGIFITDLVILEEINGGVDLENDKWLVPVYE